MAEADTALPNEKEELAASGNGVLNGTDGEDDTAHEPKAAIRKRRLQNVTWAALKLGAARKSANAAAAGASAGKSR